MLFSWFTTEVLLLERCAHCRVLARSGTSASLWPGLRGGFSRLKKPECQSYSVLPPLVLVRPFLGGLLTRASVGQAAHLQSGRRIARRAGEAILAKLRVLHPRVTSLRTKRLNYAASSRNARPPCVSRFLGIMCGRWCGPFAFLSRSSLRNAVHGESPTYCVPIFLRWLR